MLQEIAIADAYGQAFEFVKNPKEAGLKNELLDGCLWFQQNPKYLDGLLPGNFTDDTIRTIASCKLIKTYKDSAELFNPLIHFSAINKAFWEFHRKGWSSRFQKFIEENREKQSSEIFQKIVRKNTNGALMGILPFGFLSNISNVKNAAAMNAFSTHSAETIPYAQALALTVFFLRGENKICDLKSFLIENVEDLKIFKPNTNSMVAGDTFNIVISQIEKADKHLFSMSELILDCISLGGDTDSVAALCAGIFSQTDQYKKDQHFLNNNFLKIENENIRGVLAIHNSSICGII